MVLLDLLKIFLRSHLFCSVHRSKKFRTDLNGLVDGSNQKCCWICLALLLMIRRGSYSKWTATSQVGFRHPEERPNASSRLVPGWLIDLTDSHQSRQRQKNLHEFIIQNNSKHPIRARSKYCLTLCARLKKLKKRCPKTMVVLASLVLHRSDIVPRLESSIRDEWSSDKNHQLADKWPESDRIKEFVKRRKRKKILEYPLWPWAELWWFWYCEMKIKWQK